MDVSLNDISKALGSLYGIPGYLLVLFSCVVIGYALKSIKQFPNDGIPLVVILAGPLLNMVVADPYAPPQLIRVWIAKNLMVGLIVGFVAWRLHASILKKLEDKLPWLKGLVVDDDTKHLARGDTLLAEKEAEVEKQKTGIGVVKP